MGDYSLKRLEELSNKGLVTMADLLFLTFNGTRVPFSFSV